METYLRDDPPNQNWVFVCMCCCCWRFVKFPSNAKGATSVRCVSDVCIFTCVDEISNVFSCLFPFCQISAQPILSRWRCWLKPIIHSNLKDFWKNFDFKLFFKWGSYHEWFPFSWSNNGTFVRHHISQGREKTFQS